MNKIPALLAIGAISLLVEARLPSFPSGGFLKVILKENMQIMLTLVLLAASWTPPKTSPNRA